MIVRGQTDGQQAGVVEFSPPDARRFSFGARRSDLFAKSGRAFTIEGVAFAGHIL
jgi:hypothetical protein